MNVNTDTLVSISEANQNFSKVARLVDTYGSAVILKNNAPRYVILEFPKAKTEKVTVPSDDEVMALSNMFIKKNKKVYEELAKWRTDWYYSQSRIRQGKRKWPLHLD